MHTFATMNMIEAYAHSPRSMVAIMTRGHYAYRHERAEHPLLQRAIVRNGAEDWTHDRHDTHGYRRGPGISRGGDGRRQIGCGNGGKEIGEYGRDDRRLERGIGPVVHRPRAKFPSVQTQAREDFHVQYVFLAIHSRSSESTTT